MFIAQSNRCDILPMHRYFVLSQLKIAKKLVKAEIDKKTLFNHLGNHEKRQVGNCYLVLNILLKM